MTAGSPGAAAPKLFVATCTADGIMLADYVRSLAAMLIRLASQGIAAQYGANNGTDAAVQRNLLVREFLASDCTHLLFVDNDMAFPPDLAERLLGFGKRLIGIAYPRRELDIEKLGRLQATRPYADALALAHEWNVHFLPGPVEVRKGLCRVAALPGGFLMIERECLIEMADRSEVPRLSAGRDGPPLLAFFRELREGLVVTDLDYSFCRRWGACGGEVWAYAAAEMRHVGDVRHHPRFLDALDAMSRAEARGSASAPEAAR